MVVVETIAKIRRAHFVQGKSIKQICREFGMSRNTVRKVIRSGVTEFSYDRSAQPRQKIDPWRSELDQLLAEWLHCRSIRFLIIKWIVGPTECLQHRPDKPQRLFEELEMAHADGRFPRLFRSLTKTQLLILDDWGPDRLTATQRRDMLEIVEDQYGRGSTMITSQLPIKAWHDVIGEPTFADAILDRIVHNAYRLELEGQSMRKTIAKMNDENA